MDSLFTIFVLLSAVVFIVTLINPLFFKRFMNKESKKVSAFNHQGKNSQQPLQNTFYRFNHKNTEAWCKWIKHQKELTQDKAKAMLVMHTQSNPKQWGSITQEVIKAFQTLDYDDNYSLILDILQTTKIHWNEYPSLKQIYKSGFESLIKINPSQASETIITEFEHSIESDNTFIQSTLIESLTKFPDEVEMTDVWINIISNQDLSTDCRALTMTKLNTLDENKRNTILSQLIAEYIKTTITSISTKDEALILTASSNLIDSSSRDETIWPLLLEACENKELRSSILRVICDRISNPLFKVSNEIIVKLLDSYNDNSLLMSALGKRNNLIDSENSILEEEIFFDGLQLDHGAFCSESLKNIEYQVPTWLLSTYKRLDKILNKNRDIPLFYGPHQSDKLFLLRLLASQTERNFVYADIKKILKSRMTVEDFATLINESKPCIALLDNYECIDNLKNLSMDNELTLKTLRGHIAESTSDWSVAFAASSNLNHKQLIAYYKSTERLRPMTSRNPDAHIEFLPLNNSDRNFIYEKVLGKVKDERVASKSVLRSIKYSTKDLSSIELRNFLIKYIRVCLLVFGQLLTLDNIYSSLGAHADELLDVSMFKDSKVIFKDDDSNQAAEDNSLVLEGE